MCIVVVGVITTLTAAFAGVLAAPSPSQQSAPSSSFDLFMPDVQPQQADTYLCTSISVDEAHRYLTGFDPTANSHEAHHMLLYGCEEPGMAPGKVWNCGEMASTPKAKTANVCQSGHNILYAWAMDAPKLTLPDGVSYDVGQETAVKYLVLQVHYKNVSKFIPPENGHDSSGLTIHTSPSRTPKQAGVYLMVTGGFIPKQSIEYFESACAWDDDKEIVPFAYRTHAHSLGRVISGYRIRDGQWTELGRKDPRLPEMFYPVTTPGVTVKKGDILAARCTMDDKTDHDVEIGTTQNDEMCNFYVMYYVDSPPLPSAEQCVTPGPPMWRWRNFEDQEKLNLTAMPRSVSVIPGTDKPLVRTTRDRPQDYDPRMWSVIGEGSLGGQTISTDDEIPDSMQGMPGTFQEPTVEELLDETINDMNPEELIYLIQQLAREEEEDEMRKQMWIQRQRMRQQNMYPRLNQL